MSLEAYLNPDFTFGKKIIFLILTFALLGACMGILFLFGKIYGKRYDLRCREDYIKEDFEVRLQKLFEMIISGTCVMSFSTAYVVINHVYELVETGKAVNLTQLEQFLVSTWTDGKDFVLLFLICFSCVLNSVLDSFIIPLKILKAEEKATMRMLGMFFAIVTLMYLNMIGDESQYGPVMIYYFGLMIGRFVYFDASFKDFIANMKKVAQNSPIFLMYIIFTFILVVVGFKVEFFLERNYYIVGIFHTQLFMILAIFVVYWIGRICSKKQIKNYSLE
ncbi:hypothetical protein [Butyrivibrio sp. VCB2006]|uniref:hypothetical protein n=1 Tax=Butyrivibrio sp. VCB2006 TaxID=1280679 RepID=UPI0012DE5B37|nr:hypothetical protein [Butyrivibrio sp. VCB2006]